LQGSGPPFRDFRELDRAAMIDGVTMNMITPIELIQKVIGHMTARRFGRIVNITYGYFTVLRKTVRTDK
jgi:3-oxoacyl-[acyl-carrier protein] reductase